MSSPLTSGRQEFRNIHVTQIARYRLPPAGMVSILHRVSGALLFLLLPWILWLLDLSLRSEVGYEHLAAYAGHWLVKIGLLVLIWAFLHHLIAGTRYLVMDLHLAVDKRAATRSAIVVFSISLPLALLAALRLFGAF
jgi:succinate dehydrogenase / fumarate reductase cytochrome b subunit